MKLQGGLILLRETLSKLPSAEKRVAQYILNHPGKVLEFSITQLAAECGSSVAGVVRLCKRLGMRGFPELKLRVTMDVSQRAETQKFVNIEPGLPTASITRSVVYNSEQTLKDILRIIDNTAIDRAAARILVSERIDLFGVGASGIVALDLFQKLLRIGLTCYYSADSHLQITSACGLKKSDTAVAISYTGETKVVLSAVQEARKSGAFVMSITRYGKNSLSQLSDLQLFVPSTEPLIREGAMSSRIAQLVVVDILFSVIASRSSEQVLPQLTRTREALNRERS